MNAAQPLIIETNGIDGTALTNTTTGASIIPPSARQKIPGSTLGRLGIRGEIYAFGRISTVVTTPGTMTFEFRLGPTSNIIVATTPAFSLNIVAKTNVTWHLHWVWEMRALGITTSANMMHSCLWTTEAYIGAATMATIGAGVAIGPATAPAVGTGFDETVDSVSDLQADWSVANAANSIQLHYYRHILWPSIK